MTIYRQGDVLLVRVGDDVAPTGPCVPRVRGRVELAQGESTGHVHAICSEDAVLYETAAHGAAALRLGERLLKTRQTVMLEHEEHATIHVPAGTWMVRIQRTYERGSMRSVAD